MKNVLKLTKTLAMCLASHGAYFEGNKLNFDDSIKTVFYLKIPGTFLAEGKSRIAKVDFTFYVSLLQ